MLVSTYNFANANAASPSVASEDGKCSYGKKDIYLSKSVLLPLLEVQCHYSCWIVPRLELPRVFRSVESSSTSGFSNRKKGCFPPKIIEFYPEP